MCLGVLALAQPVAASAQVGEREPVRPQLPGNLRPGIRDQLPLPREADLALRCLTAERSINVIHKAMFGFNAAPLPVLPDFALRDDVVAATTAVTASMPAPAPPAIAPPGVIRLEKEALRTALAPPSARAAALRAHLELMRGQIRLLRAGRDDAAALAELRATQIAAHAQPGPTPDEFATLATIHGDPAPCKDPLVAKTRTPRKLALEARFAAYRFGDELYRVFSTLDGSGAVRTDIPKADPGSCGLRPRASCNDIRPEIALLPYWLSRERLARYATGQGHPIDAFHDALALTGTAMNDAADRFRTRFRGDGAALLLQAQVLQQQLRGEQGQVEAWQRQLDAEAAALAALRVEITRRQSWVSEIDAALPSKESAIARMKQDMAAAKARRAELSAPIAAKRDSIGKLRAAIGSLKLNCNGANYAACMDDAAKLDYDRRRYDLYEKLNTALAELADLQTKQQAEASRAAELQGLVTAAQNERLDLIAERAEAQVYLTTTIPELNARQAKWETDSTRAKALREGNDADRAVVDALVVLATSEP